jgi:hypothetical protein
MPLPPHTTNPSRRAGVAVRASPLVLACAAALASAWLTGCASSPYGSVPVVAAYRPDNFYRLAPRLAPDVRRVAVLPISADPGDWQAAEGSGALQPVLQSELGKAQMFELASVSGEQLRQWSGKEIWQAEERLPTNFLAQVRDATGCDAVLFSHLHPFHAYRPLVVGWRFKLVDARTAEVLWAVDEVFDSADAAVANAAQRYAQTHGESWRPLADPSSILASPKRFSQYTVSALLATLPAR